MNVRGITEDMVVRTEVYVKCLLDAAFELVVDEEKFKNTISVDGFKRLEHGRFVGSDAVSFVMEPMTLAMGGHLLMGSGGYMDGPTSPLIQVALDAHKIHVLDTISAKNMVINYNEHKTSGFFQARRGLNPDHKAVDLGPDDTVFVGVHRPNHFVSMIVKNLGGDTAASMTVADSFSLPSFSCLTHDALRTAFRERKLIGKEHEIDHFGLALPHQDRCDCAFYMLTYLATVLTEAFLLPELWGWFTRLMRCWTFFLVFRGLVDNQAIHKEASQARPDSNAERKRSGSNSCICYSTARAWHSGHTCVYRQPWHSRQGCHLDESGRAGTESDRAGKAKSTFAVPATEGQQGLDDNGQSEAQAACDRRRGPRLQNQPHGCQGQ
jgi:hypothetical protein